MTNKNEKYIYAAYKNADMTEGRGPMIPVAFFTTEKLAMDFCEGKRGIMEAELDRLNMGLGYNTLRIK